MPPEDRSIWGPWSEHVLYQIEHQAACHDELDKKVDKMDVAFNVEIAKLKTELRLKAGIWGLIAGAIPVAIALLVLLVSKILSGGVVP